MCPSDTRLGTCSRNGAQDRRKGGGEPLRVVDREVTLEMGALQVGHSQSYLLGLRHADVKVVTCRKHIVAPRSFGRRWREIRRILGTGLLSRTGTSRRRHTTGCWADMARCLTRTLPKARSS
jgi:hypothetical protein